MTDTVIFVTGVVVFLTTTTATLLFGYLRFGQLYRDQEP